MPILSAPTKRASASAPPLPATNRILNSNGIFFREGQFSILAAAPGVGKSLFATNLSIFTGVDTLYLSADSDEFTVKTRACSILTGIELSRVEQYLQEEAWEGYLQGQLQASDHVDWCYQVDIDPEFIGNRINAYSELRGVHPRLLVVDNLGNTVEENTDEFAELRRICRDLQRVARNTRAHVMGLHHVVGAKEDGVDPITLKDLVGKIGKIPEMVLGLNRAGENYIQMTVPKQRGGKSNFAVTLPIDYNTATIGGFR